MESDFKHQSSRAWVGVASEQRETRSPLESTVQLKTPRGITVEEAAQLLRYSTSTVRRLIAAHILVAWKPGGPAGRKYLIDEIALARWQASEIARARQNADSVQSALLQGELPLVW
ncbi:MAG: helix-turn-helix domain-containing protein [Akkermansia sp.]|nr:helix-turn-helix domain-containing protein [Akkermansia sp.]